MSAARAAFVVWVDHDGPDGGFVAFSGFVPGCVASGATIAETLENFLARYKEVITSDG